MFIVICMVGWVFSVVILFLDFRGNKVLLKSAKEREVVDYQRMEFIAGDDHDNDDDSHSLVPFPRLEND